nr:HGGxSTG domain-containing protein [Belnapia moabensis]
MPLAHGSPRCGAKTRSGQPCRAPAMSNGRCRMHGGASTGPRTPEGLARLAQARMTHGRYSAEPRIFRKAIRDLLDRRSRQNR